MNKGFCLLFFSFLLIGIAINCIAQDSSRTDKILNLPNKLFNSLSRNSAKIESAIDKQTEKYLSRIQKQENKLRKKIYKKDPLLAKKLFEGSDSNYNNLKNYTGNLNKFHQVYSPHLDSITTSLHFLRSTDKSPINKEDIEKSITEYKLLQSRLNAADQIKNYFIQLKKLLKEQLSKLGMVKELKDLEKEVYYYQAQINQYRQDLEDPTKLEKKLLSLIRTIPQFKDFFSRNSLLSTVLPQSENGDLSGALSNGLQSRSSLNQAVTSRFGNSVNLNSVLQQNSSVGQGQLNDLKNKFNGIVSKASSNSIGKDADMPDFKLNHQKTKTFLNRLELGTNLQSKKGTSYFPITTDIGLSVGYKLNDKSVVGIGMSAKLGWGTSWNNFKISYQGVGLRSFFDFQLKGSFYVSGGYEQNYFNAIHSISQLKKYIDWKTSGLIGISKHYQLNKKFKGEMKLLWDFLSYQQIPQTQSVIFRIGYSIK